MALEQIFSLCGVIAMIGWAGLVFTPRWAIARDWVAPVIIPLIIAVFYIWLMATSTAPQGGGFGSLAAVATLFSVDQLLLAGWIHYLAFDLFVGAWEVRDAQKRGIHHLLVVPCLVATFMVGPGGLALYWLVRLAHQAITASAQAQHGSNA